MSDATKQLASTIVSLALGAVLLGSTGCRHHPTTASSTSPAAPGGISGGTAPLAKSPAPPAVKEGAAAPAPPTAPAVTSAAVVAAPTNTVAAATNAIGGKIKFETPVYDFGKAKAGELVHYTYVFTNTDEKEVLEVRGVQPQCGCTTAGAWTRRTEPGQTGSIPIQFNSANYNGGVLKMITVTTSDKSQQSLVLQLKGTIWRPIEVVPMYAIISVSADTQSGSTTVRVVNNMPESVDVFDPQCNNRSFTALLTTNKPGKEFALAVSTVGALSPGTTSGQIILKTTSTNVPTVNLIAMANVTPAITVSPPQLNLPMSPLPATVTNTITIQNNSTNKLVLTEPAVNAKDVSVQIKEMQTNKMFVALVGFPQSFEMPPGQPVVLTIKSSLPQFPLIKVPVTQPPRPPGAPRPPAAAAPPPMAPRLLPPPAPAPVKVSSAPAAASQ